MFSHASNVGSVLGLLWVLWGFWVNKTLTTPAIACVVPKWERVHKGRLLCEQFIERRWCGTVMVMSGIFGGKFS